MPEAVALKGEAAEVALAEAQAVLAMVQDSERRARLAGLIAAVGDGEVRQARGFARPVRFAQCRRREPRVEDGVAVEGEEAEAVCGARGHGVKRRGRVCAGRRPSGASRVWTARVPPTCAARVDVCRSTSRPTLSP